MKPNLNESRIESLSDLISFGGKPANTWSKWYFRGVHQKDYKLVPKAGRTSNLDDAKLFYYWKKHAAPHMPLLSHSPSEWEMLSIAQHHGLATRLMDWTFNILVAGYFACEGDKTSQQVDGVVYAHYSTDDMLRFREGMDASESSVQYSAASVFEYTGKVARVRPPAVARRISVQGGIFTIHPKPEVPMTESLSASDEWKQGVIPAGCKQALLAELTHLGINRMSLFPDLDGISSHMNWVFSNLPAPPEPPQAEVGGAQANQQQT